MKLLPTDQPDLWFEDTAVGRLKKEVWEADDAQIDQWLADYGVPSPCEWARCATRWSRTGGRTTSC
jgi:hypothetical protein